MAAYRRPNTQEEKERAAAAAAKKLEDLHSRLAAQVARLVDGPEWKRWLTVAARFHTYSFNNTLLIWAQNPDATEVAGYRTWQRLGRQVEKGQRGIQVLAPVTRRSARDTATETTAPGENPGVTEPQQGPAQGQRRSIVGFRVAHVWDVSQTSGEPLPEQPTPQLLRGEAPDGLWDALADQVAAAGYTLTRGECPGGANGVTYFKYRAVVVRADVDDAQAVKTLAHELGHVLLHDPGREDLTSARICRGVLEVEAESFAYLVGTHAGLSTDDYTFPYVASWAATVGKAAAADPAAVVTATATRVLRTAAPVIDRIDTARSLTAPAVDAELVERTAAAVAASGELLEQARSAVRSIEAVGPGRARLLAAHDAAAAWFRSQLLDPAQDGPRQYLEQRGLGWVIAGRPAWASDNYEDRWQVGYAPAGWTGLVDHLRATGFSGAEIEAAGLALRSRKGTLIDRFRDRITLPMRDVDGRVIAFIGRAPDERGPDTPKYLNSPTTPLFNKGKQLYGLGQQDITRRRVVLEEGPLDVLATVGAVPGVAALAPSGTAFTGDHAQRLFALDPADVVVAFDADQAGRQAALRAWEQLRPYFSSLLAAGFPAGSDPAAVAEQAPAELAQLLTAPERLHPLEDLVVDTHLDEWTSRPLEVVERVQAARSVAGLISDMPFAQVHRQIGRAADRLDVLPSTVAAAVAKRLDPLTDSSTSREASHGQPQGVNTTHQEASTARPAAVAATAFNGRQAGDRPQQPPIEGTTAAAHTQDDRRRVR